MELFQPNLYKSYVNVIYVRKNSPAYEAGIRVGDVIRFIDDKEISLFSDRYSQNNSGVIIMSDGAVSDRYGSAGVTFNDPEIDSGKVRVRISLAAVKKMFRESNGRTISITYKSQGNENLKTVRLTLKKEF